LTKGTFKFINRFDFYKIFDVKGNNNKIN
jgi:hypothetical protein